MVTPRQRAGLHYPDKPLHHFLRDRADSEGERVALRFDGDDLTFRELDARGTNFANALARLGVAVGQRAVLAAGNRPEWLMASHGMSQAGVAGVLANSSWRQAELEHAFGVTKPEVVVADLAVADRLASVRFPLPGIRICLDQDPPAGWIPFWDLISGVSGRRPPDLDVDLSQLEAFLPFSSGTTGLPKAVRHSHASLVAATVQRCAGYGISAGDRLQFFMPLFTIYGVIVSSSAFASGATLRLFRRFDAPTVLRNLAEERITVGFAAAPIAVSLRDQPDLESYDLSALRYLMWGATPVIPDVAEEVSSRSGIRWFVAYSTTESGIAANLVERPDLWRLDSPGIALSDVEIRIVSPDTGVDVEPGDAGEIVVRSPSMMLGYLPEDDDDSAFMPGGWLRTGDIGWQEREGWIHLTDRSKEMIKSSGFQVAPAELENLLFTHPSIKDCAVYGIPDRRRGEAPTAAVVVSPGAELREQEVIEYVSGRLATYKHLEGVAFVDEIPRNPAGKVLRRVLRDSDPRVGGAVPPEK
jgi:acyl-CoA synthetase (AMP-forming)/AMP-acid ligase II